MCCAFFWALAEAGLYPGMILYMTYWFPAGDAGALHRPVPGGGAGGQRDRRADLGLAAGFRWRAAWLAMDAAAGRHSVGAAGCAVLWLLPDRPATAKWLSADEKAILAARLAATRDDRKPGALHGFWEMLADKRIWIFIIPDFSIVIGLYGMGLWMPQMIKALGFSNLQTGFLVALPYVVSMIAMVRLGISSDRSGERVWHVAGRALRRRAGPAGRGAAAQSAAGDHLSFCVAASGIYAALAVFWTLPTAILRGMAAAGGLALLNSFSNLGGFFGPDPDGLG